MWPVTIFFEGRCAFTKSIIKWARARGNAWSAAGRSSACSATMRRTGRKVQRTRTALSSGGRPARSLAGAGVCCLRVPCCATTTGAGACGRVRGAARHPPCAHAEKLQTLPILRHAGSRGRGRARAPVTLRPRRPGARAQLHSLRCRSACARGDALWYAAVAVAVAVRCA